jgi:signal transduction histidine kinase
VHISLELFESGFSLQIEDDGKGLDPGGPGMDLSTLNQARVFTGHGLPNMLKRMEEIGGKCHIQSMPSKGMRVRFIIRIKSSAQNAPAPMVQ